MPDASGVSFTCGLCVLVFLVALACGWFKWDWYWRSLGWFYGVAISLSGFLVFIGACLVVTKRDRPTLIVSYFFVVPLPFFIGIYGSIEGVIISLQPHHGRLNLADAGTGISTSLCAMLVGLAVTSPSYLVILIGLFARLSLRDRSSSTPTLQEDSSDG